MNWDDIFTGRSLRNIELLHEAIDRFPAPVKRALLLTLTASVGQMSKMVFAITSRGKTSGLTTNKIEVGSWVIGYWRPKQHFEINVWNCFELRANKVLKSLPSCPATFQVGNRFADFEHGASAVIDPRGASAMLEDIPTSSLQLVVTDPPHGDRIPYLELSEMWNALLGKQQSMTDEVVVSNAKERKKDLTAYNAALTAVLRGTLRSVRDGGFIVLLFNSRHQAEWSAISALCRSEGISLLGGLPLHYSARSVVQDNRAGAMKNDLILIFAKGSIDKRRAATLQSIAGWTDDPISLGGNA